MIWAWIWNDVDPRGDRSEEAFLLEKRQRLANRCAAHADAVINCARPPQLFASDCRYPYRQSRLISVWLIRRLVAFNGASAKGVVAVARWIKFSVVHSAKHVSSYGGSSARVPFNSFS